MLLNLHKKKWTDGLILRRFDAHSETNEQTVQVTINLPRPLKNIFFTMALTELRLPYDYSYILRSCRKC
jgi:hypothetical protein